MAIYHLSLKVGSRIGGQSAVAKADYIEREGKYEKDHEELEYRESENMPGWAEGDPRQYWAAADEHERANGRLFVQVEVALPVELDQEQRRDLARSFGQELTGSERLPYTMAIHRGESQKPGKPDNPHVHLMISERGLDGHDRNAATWFKRANAQDPEKGGAKKTSLSSKEWLADTRQRWETAANRALERAGSAERIDHRSLAAQREDALQRGDIERAAELSRIPHNVPGPEIHRAARGGPSRVLEIAERIGRSNAEARAERADANTEVDRAALVVQERRDVMTARLQALDTEIRATRLAVVKEAARRGLVQLAKTVKTGATWVREIPRRRQEAAARRSEAMTETTPPDRQPTPRPTADDNYKQFADEIIKQIEKGEGLTLPEWKGAEITPGQAQYNVENVIRANGVPIREVNGDRAAYNIQSDDIVLPLRTQFRRAESYYQTALHEVGHSTGHPSRMNRESLQQGCKDGFGSPAYALEELTTELSTMLSSARLGVAYEPQHGTFYADSWLKTLKDDPQKIYRAVEEAGRISDYVCTAPERELQGEKAPGHQEAIDTHGRELFLQSLEIPRPEWGRFSEEQRLADDWEGQNWREAKKVKSDVQQAHSKPQQHQNQNRTQGPEIDLDR